MNIDLLSKIIKELLINNEEVTLPNIGTFATEIIPASFSDKGYVINPPYKKLSFRHKNNINDSLITDFYARKNNINKETAEHIINEYTIELKQVLYQKKVIVFPYLGRLRATKENHIFFIPDEDIDIFANGFGLEPISLKNHSEEEVENVVKNMRNLITSENKSNIDSQNTEDEQNIIDNKNIVEQQNIIEEQNKEDESLKEQQIEPQNNIEDIHTECVESEHIIIEDTKEETHENKENHQEDHGKKIFKKTIIILLIVAILLLVLLITFIILAKIAPDFIDSILYSPEQLEILKLK